MFQITADHTTETTIVAYASDIAAVLEAMHHGLTDQTRRDIAAVVDMAIELEDGETLGSAYYATRSLGVYIKRTPDNGANPDNSPLALNSETPSRILQSAKWETKRGGKLTNHSIELEIFYFSATAFEYNVRTQDVTLSINGGKATKTVTDTVESFPSMKRAVESYNWALTSGKGPEAKRLSY